MEALNTLGIGKKLPKTAKMVPLCHTKWHFGNLKGFETYGEMPILLKEK